MPLIAFPNIPFVPGVPLIPRSPLFPPTVQIALGLVQSLLWQVFQSQTRWGIFDESGAPIFNTATFDLLSSNSLSTYGVDYSKETKVSDFPIEGGSFASFNKVETSAAPVVTLIFSGSESDRASFINTIDAACKSQNLYSIATPEVTYINYSIARYGYQRRNDHGANIYIVEIGLMEIREVSAQFAQISPIKDPKALGATPPVDTGKVQAKVPEQSTFKRLATQLGQ